MMHNINLFKLLRFIKKKYLNEPDIIIVKKDAIFVEKETMDAAYLKTKEHIYVLLQDLESAYNQNYLDKKSEKLTPLCLKLEIFKSYQITKFISLNEILNNNLKELLEDCFNLLNKIKIIQSKKFLSQYHAHEITDKNFVMPENKEGMIIEYCMNIIKPNNYDGDSLYGENNLIEILNDPSITRIDYL